MGSSYDDWTVQELKEALKERGLPVSGNKHVLIERLENSEGLEGSMAASKPTSEGKNYLEGALDAGDAELVEQINEKYGAPDYRAPEFGNKSVQLNLAIIALCVSGIAISYLFTVHREKEATELVTAPCFATLILFAMLFFWVSVKAEEINVDAFSAPWTTSGLLLLIIVTGLGLGWTFWKGLVDYDIYINDREGARLFFYGCSSLFLLTIPFLALTLKSDNEARERAKPASWSKRETERMVLWESARDYEKYRQFDAATGIWSKLGEEGEVERVAGLKAEYLCVVLKRKIKALTEQGADCTQLEEQLAMIETSLEESATSPLSIGTEIEQ